MESGIPLDELMIAYKKCSSDDCIDAKNKKRLSVTNELNPVCWYYADDCYIAWDRIMMSFIPQSYWKMVKIFVSNRRPNQISRMISGIPRTVLSSIFNDTNRYTDSLIPFVPSIHVNRRAVLFSTLLTGYDNVCRLIRDQTYTFIDGTIYETMKTALNIRDE
jgi:hypothetical protein